MLYFGELSRSSEAHASAQRPRNAKDGRTVHSPKLSRASVGAAPSFSKKAGKHTTPAMERSGAAIVLAMIADESCQPNVGRPTTAGRSPKTAT
jgi:hypothetical protein